MRHKKDKILIVALSSLVLFTSSLAFTFYTKREAKGSDTEEKVMVLVTKKALLKGEKIGPEHLENKAFLKNSVTFKVPMTEEILGKYANTDMLESEPIRLEKVTLNTALFIDKPIDKNETSLKKYEEIVFSNNSVTLPMSLFRNSDYSLKSGDFIDIATVKEMASGEKFQTVYTALHVPVLAFGFKGDLKPSFTQMFTINKEVKKEFADSIVLDMSPKEIKNFLASYYGAQEFNEKKVHNKDNTGHLWMVKTHKNVLDAHVKEKEGFLVDVKPPKQKYDAPKKSASSVVVSYEQ